MRKIPKAVLFRTERENEINKGFIILGMKQQTFSLVKLLSAVCTCGFGRCTVSALADKNETINTKYFLRFLVVYISWQFSSLFWSAFSPSNPLFGSFVSSEIHHLRKFLKSVFTISRAGKMKWWASKMTFCCLVINQPACGIYLSHKIMCLLEQVLLGDGTISGWFTCRTGMRHIINDSVKTEIQL